MTDVLDMSVVEELLTLMGDEDPELLLDLIGMFQTDGPARLDRIEKAFGAEDYTGVAEVAHSLKGSAGNLGLTRLQNDCEVLQVAGKRNDVATVTDAMSIVRQHLEEGIAALTELQQKYS